MKIPLLTIKLYIPRSRPELVVRPRLFELLNVGLKCKLILILVVILSAPASFIPARNASRLTVREVLAYE